MGRSLLLALRDVSCGESRFMSGKVTAKDVGAGVTLLAVTPWAAGFEQNAGVQRFTFKSFYP